MVQRLPEVNAILNSTAALCLIVGYICIRLKKIAAHRILMITAFCASILFLISYLYYHAQIGSKHFEGVGLIRVVYFTLLFSHTLLAAVVPVLSIVTLYRAFKKDFPRHQKIAKWTLPIWLYVSVTGVIIYKFLY